MPSLPSDPTSVFIIGIVIIIIIIIIIISSIVSIIISIIIKPKLIWMTGF